MGIIEVFDRNDIGPWLKSLSAIELADLDALLREKNGRFYFQCSVRKKNILAKSEECVRQYWLHLLQVRVCFETVDIGANGKKDEHQVKWTWTFRCRRDHPNKGEVYLRSQHRDPFPHLH
jgi:hypothetical protein